MATVPTWQDMEKAVLDNKKTDFILKAIKLYKESDLFLQAKLANEYYARNNRAIKDRMSFLERKGVSLNVTFHKLACGFYPEMIDEWTAYTLGDGLTLDAAKKEKLGKDFEYLLLNEGVIPAANAGVCWGFWNNDKIIFFQAYKNNGYDGFFPLYDERTGNAMVGVRFWQTDAEKPMYVELFEGQGITEFISNGKDKGLVESIPLRAYKTKVYRDEITEFVVDTENYPELPIFPLYTNRLKVSEFNAGFQSYVDAYDFISSDQVDQILTSEGINAVVKNFGGESFQELFEKLQGKIFPVDENAGTDVAMNVVEAPHQAKQATLDFIERRIYSDFPMPNPRLDGKATTATEIKDANKKLNIKSDILEWYACKFVESILRIQGVPFEKDEVKFARRGVINDTEMVDNISTMLSDQYIDAQAALELNPLIDDSKKPEILKRLDLEAKAEADLRFELEKTATENVVVEDVELEE